MGNCFESQSINKEDLEDFYPNITKAHCISVYDGDTIHIAGYVDGKFYRFMCRMYGYDSPELRSKNEEEKKSALIAKHALEQRVLDKVVNVKVHHIREKYGRLLVTLSDSGGNINEWMISNGYGYPYEGGTKKKFNQSS